MASVSVLNTDTGLSAKTLDILESDQTITGLKTFSRAPNAPYAVQSGSANVTNLDADLLDGQHGSFYSSAANLTGTLPSASAPAATIQTTTLTGTQNNFAQTAARRLLLYCNNASLLTITGFTAGTDGDEIEVVSIGAGQVDFSHQNASSTAANRLINAVTSCVTSLAAGSGTARFRYDGTTARWRLTHHEQGTWIASGITTLTGNGGGTPNGTYSANRYRISGRSLQWNFDIGYNIVGTITSVDMALPISGALTAAVQYNTAAATNASSLAMVSSQAAGSSTLRQEMISAGGTVNFGTGSNIVRGTATVELQ